jgi:N-acetylneuraminic acid mutarotase
LTKVNGTIYLFGGYSTATSSLSDLWNYNINSNEFQEIIPVNTTEGRYYHAATAADNMLWVFGGVGASGYVLSDIVTYSAATNRWTPQPSSGDAPGGRVLQSAVTMPDGSICIFGGDDNSHSLVPPDVWKYSTSTGVWEKIGYTYPNAPAPRRGHVAAVIAGKMIVWGGFGGWGGSGALTYLNDMWAFDPQTKQWTSVPIHGITPPPLFMAGAASYGNTLWTFGGETLGGQLVNTVTRFTLRGVAVVDVEAKTEVGYIPAMGIPTGIAFTYDEEEEGGNTARTRTTQVNVLLFGGKRNGQAIADTLVLTYTVEVPSSNIYLPLILR